jgi:hypothetical protein
MIDWLIFVGAVGIVVAFVPRIWRTGRIYKSDRMPTWWPYGERAWSAHTRSVPTAAIGACFGTASFVATGTLSGVLFAGCLVCAAVWMFIIILNHPKFAVPPSKRSDTGLAVDWFRYIRARLRRTR